MKKSSNIRQIVLVLILVVVLAAFLYDKYVLIPSATAKINEVVSTVSLKLSEENRQQIHDVVGIKPSNTFTYKGYEVEQYRFPRGLPGFPRPILDVAYQGNTMAFFRQTPIDNAYIDSQRPIFTDVNKDAVLDPGHFTGPGAPPRNANPENNSTDDSSNESEGSDSSSDSDEDSDS